MACSPSVTTCSGFANCTRAKARCVSATSFESSSTSKMLPLLRSILHPRRRKLDPEARAFPRLRLDTDTAAHPLGAAPHDREADAGARIHLSTVQTLQYAKDVRMIPRVDAGPIVLDPSALRSASRVG